MKNLKTTALASFVVLALSSISSVSAADGTINFTGEITDAGCNTSVNGSSATTGDVDMGKVVKTSFKGVGSTVDGSASSTGFTIEMDDCPSTVTSVTFKFDGQNENGDDTVLALTAGANSATGVGIQLYDKDRNVIQLAKASAPYTITNTGAGSTNSLPFYAKYIQTQNTVTTGPANSVATFTVNY
ncbi:fimbrial protein [Kosakonia sp. MUSA4]|uniref:fimbrial protein n=1 Tax=Kosakonia sp. MUSA4 TaxID=2067958 RepID=UPI0008D1A0B2|nr:fimbrial protein [Kosakonia sp. MUSA4]QJT82425.1 ferrous iron transporter B [Kosakonia sp. MUSA4]SEK25204.1 major type 1 subunit fimbrin (pilin) [Kosakonia sacchari]